MNKLRAMNPEQAAALFRTILQVAGGMLGMWGIMTETQWAAISGPAGTLLFTLWGMYARRDVALLSSAGNVPSAVVVAPPEVANAIKNKDVITPLEAKARGIGAGAALALLLCLTPLLGACTMTQAGVGAPSAAVATKADVAVAKASAEVVKYCGYVRAALGVGSLFAAREITVRAIEYAEGVVEAYCDQPPTDVVTALGTLQRAYQTVLAAQRT